MSQCDFTSFDDNELNLHLKKNCIINNYFSNIYNYNIETFGKNKFGEDGGDIYIIQTDFSTNNHFKIGKTNNLVKRLSTYRCGSLYEPRLYYYYPFRNIQNIDEKLKELLKPYRLKLEIYIGELDLFREIINNL